MYEYLDLDGMVKISETLNKFDSSIDWSKRVENYVKKHKDIEVIRKSNAYYGSYEVFCYYLQNAKSDVLDKSLCEVEVSREYIKYLKDVKEIDNYRDSGGNVDDLKAIYGYKSMDDMYNQILRDFRECKSKDETFKIIMKWISALTYMQKLNTTKTKITTIRTLIEKDSKVDSRVKNYIKEFLLLPDFIYKHFNEKRDNTVKALELDNSNLFELNSKNVTDLIKRLHRELKSDLRNYDLNSLDKVRDGLIANRVLTKVTTKLAIILGLATGRRLAELMVNANFKETKREKNETLERVLFSGVAKKRDSDDTLHRIPIIELGVNEIDFYSKILKELIPDSIKKLIDEERELRDISNRFQTYIKRNWSNYSDYNIDDMRDCRGAYALYCLLIDNKNATTEAYIKSILLHDSKESASNYWTKFKMVK